MPTLASCSFNKHGLILIIFGKQHQRIFKNDKHVQLSLSHHFYLLYSLLISCDGNDTFWRHSMVMKQSSFFSRKHRTLSLQICVRQTVRSTIEFVNWRRTCIHYTNTCPRYQPLWPATWSSASLTQWPSISITKRHRQSSWSMEKAVTCKHEAKLHHLNIY